MNVTTNNRLIGIAVALIALFALSWLIPGQKARPRRSRSIPVAAVPVGSSTSPNPSVQATPLHSGTPSVSESAVVSTNPEASMALTKATKESPPEKRRAAEREAGGPSVAPPKQSPRPAARAPARQQAVALKKRVLVPSSAKDATAGFYIQIASYRDFGDARKTASLLRHKFVRTKINRTMLKGHRYYRVRLGPYSTRHMAEAVSRRLAGDGFHHTWVIRSH